MSKKEYSKEEIQEATAKEVFERLKEPRFREGLTDHDIKVCKAVAISKLQEQV